jgi:tetratricopeptide (TPR) repeat protein
MDRRMPPRPCRVRPGPDRVDAQKSTNPAPSRPRSDASEPASAPRWRQSWQLPALVLAGVLLVGGVASSVLMRPKPDFTGEVARARRLVEAEQYKPALELLNGKIRPYLDAGKLPKEFVPELHLLRARAIYLGQRAEGVDLKVNHENVAGEYLAAERAGAKLEPRDQYFLADTYVSLDRLDRALDRLDALPSSERIRRGQLLRRMVQVRMAVRSPDVVATLALLAEFLKDTELGVSDRAWALARQAELLIRQGYADEAIAKLLRSMPGMMSGDREQVGELYELLGRAYLDRNAVVDASKALEQAVRLLPELDERRGEAMVLLARIDSGTRDGLDDARNKYAAVVEQYGATPAKLPALLGLAETEAAQNDHASAAEAYGRLVGALSAGEKHREVGPDTVSKSLLDRFQDRFGSGDTPAALRYATLAEQLFPSSSAPAPVLLALGSANRKSAEELLAVVGVKEARLADLARLDPATRELARMHLVAAGGYYRRYAAAVVDKDNDAYGRAIWMAADSFDLAGDQGEAIPLFAEYANGFPGDNRQAEATFRLAQAQQARGDVETAARLYRSLIDGSVGSPGPYSDASYVPLARALLDDHDPDNDSEASALLAAVVNGRIGGTGSPHYHDALIELADVHYRAGEYAPAIERLEEAVARYPEDPKIDGLRYKLADANRLEAAAILRSFEQPMPDDQRRMLEQTRVERLRTALALFDAARGAMEAKDARRMSEVERIQMRNATFYVADCAFELGQYDEAIRRYDAAREHYPRDPASLVAMVQIVNAYMAQGDVKRAATANERAMRFYKSLPDDAWADPALPMSKADWQRWLESLKELTPIGGEGGVPEPKKTTRASESSGGP